MYMQQKVTSTINFLQSQMNSVEHVLKEYPDSCNANNTIKCQYNRIFSIFYHYNVFNIYVSQK